MERMVLKLHRNLTSGEYRRITARLNLYHSVELLLTKQTSIGKAVLASGMEPSEIILIKDKEYARLSYPQTHERKPHWDGIKRTITVEVGAA